MTITEKWSTTASKMVDQGAPQMLRAALTAFAAASGPAAIADALEPKGGGGGGAGEGLDEGAVGLLELLVLYRKSLAALPAGTIPPPTADTDRVVALCAQRLDAAPAAKSSGATAHAER